ncbi:MAG: alcohol dehydrogenase catalytic domain-containing protein [Chloroflexi bacterium]|nr:alcohol dehydrogenase catalytic domain-containing protein [Chloroflexota bacterium]MDA1147669.1 alcohol dehydrogenase catalytic domain-containing protein [Chloroflexota bacterium]
MTTDDPGRWVIEEYEADPPGPGEVLLRVRASGICGSDLHSYRDESRWLSPEGGWRAGRTPGHEVAGEVAGLGAGVRGLTAGQRVALQPRPFCGVCTECRAGKTELCQDTPGLIGEASPGGCSEYLVVPAANLFPVADDLDFSIAALAEPLAVAVHGYRVAAQLDATRPTAGERVVVLGAGPIGLMSVFYAAQSGAEVAVTYRYPQQRAAALRLGAAHTFEADGGNEDALRAWAHEHPVDLVMETVGGAAETPAVATRVVRRGGRVLLLGVPARQVTLPAQVILTKQLRLAATVFYGYIGMQHDYEITTRLLDEHRDVLGTLITHRVPLDEAASGYALAADKASGAIKVSIQP